MLSKGLELRHSTGAEFARALQVAAEGSAPIRSASSSAPHKPVTKPGRIIPPPPKNQPAESPFNRQFAILLFIFTPLLGLALAAGFWFISQFVFSPRTATPEPTPSHIVLQSDYTPPVPTFAAPTPTIAPTAIQNTPTPIPSTAVPTLSAPGEAIIAEDSPFTSLMLALNKTEDGKPDHATKVFSPTKDPI